LTNYIWRYRRLATRGLLALFLPLWLVPQAIAQPAVTAVRVGAHEDKTRFVLELTEAPRYRVFTLDNPYRVVIDLPELEWRPDSGALPSGAGMISAMRFGLFAPGTSRVVLDVSRPVLVKTVFTIPPGAGQTHRLVVDIAPATPQQFAAARATPIVSTPPLEPLRTAMPAVPAPRADDRPMIVIDPGHGGVDPGAHSISGADEKDITLAYAFELKRQLEATGRYRVAMTRDRDIFLQLRDRVEMAQRLGGDLFISLHANNHRSRNIKGVSVYTLSEQASDSEAEALAAKENKADIIAGIDLSDQTEVVSKILIDLAQRETMNLSKQLGNTMVHELGKVTALLANTHRFAGFAVLKSPTVPSVLVEVGYLSNREEEKLLRTPQHKAVVTTATIKAIDEYFQAQKTLNRS
jgi:N-acetylmuramoyl-L-alanine amidase